MVLDLQKRLYDLLHVDMSEWRAEEISKVTVDALHFLQDRLGYKIELDRNLTEEEIKELIFVLESNPEFKTYFKGFKQKIRWGMQRLAFIWNDISVERDDSTSNSIDSNEKVMLGISRLRNNKNKQQNRIEKIVEATREGQLVLSNVDMHEQGDNEDDSNLQNSFTTCEELKEFLENATLNKDKKEDGNRIAESAVESDYQTFCRKVFDVLEKYPDVGLIPEQILDLTGQDFYEVKTVVEILKNAKWCKERRKRYYFVSVEDYEEPDVTQEVVDVFASYATEIEIDENAKELMSDPSELLKFLQNKKK